jgi:hypothetical protein
MNHHNDTSTACFENSIVARSCKLALYARKCIGDSNRNRGPSSRTVLNLTSEQTKYTISKLSAVEKESVVLRIKTKKNLNFMV